MKKHVLTYRRSGRPRQGAWQNSRLRSITVARRKPNTHDMKEYDAVQRTIRPRLADPKTYRATEGPHIWHERPYQSLPIRLLVQVREYPFRYRNENTKDDLWNPKTETGTGRHHCKDDKISKTELRDDEMSKDYQNQRKGSNWISETQATNLGRSPALGDWPQHLAVIVPWGNSNS